MARGPLTDAEAQALVRDHWPADQRGELEAHFRQKIIGAAANFADLREAGEDTDQAEVNIVSWVRQYRRHFDVELY